MSAPTFAWATGLCARRSPLEGWSDARTVDGTATVLQPLIRPLYGGRTVHQVLATLAGEPGLESYEAVRRTWREILGVVDFEAGGAGCCTTDSRRRPRCAARQ